MTMAQGGLPINQDCPSCDGHQTGEPIGSVAGRWYFRCQVSACRWVFIDRLTSMTRAEAVAQSVST